MTRLVAVSNRMPPESAGAGRGGLAVALEAVLRQRGGLWLGWSGAVVESPARVARLRHGGGVTLAALDLSPDEHAGFYLGFSNRVLWPLCHASSGPAPHDTAQYAAYWQVNRRYAESLLPLLQPDDVVWVHDYHLLPLGRMLRDAHVAQPVGFFLHVPFPELAALQAAPGSAELMQSLLAYDVLGFQTGDDLAAFHAAARWQWGAACLQNAGSVRIGERRLRLGVFPVGVDVDDIRREVRAARDARMVRDAGAMRCRGTLLIGADRVETSKGLLEKSLAFEAYLAQPEPHPRRCHLLQLATPGRPDSVDASRLAASLQELAARINARHGCADWLPLRHLDCAVAHDVLMGLFQAAHVGLVTPLRDGMNLVAKEFIAAQDPADPGVLVLSRFAGAARELPDAVQVDPRDPAAMVEAIRHACSMPLPERRARHARMIAALRRNDLRSWHGRFLHELQQCRA